MTYEEQMLEFNKKLYPEIKNVYINCDEGMQSVSSSAFRELKNQPEKWNEYLTDEVIKVLLKALQPHFYTILHSKKHIKKEVVACNNLLKINSLTLTFACFKKVID